MPRKSTLQTPILATADEAIAQGLTTPTRRNRTAMHTARIIKTQINEFTTMFVALFNGKVTTQLAYNANEAAIEPIYDNFGSYEGFPKYYRTHSEHFTTVLITKSADEEVAKTQADPYVVDAFVRRYVDGLQVKAMLAAEQAEGSALVKPEQTESQNSNHQALSEQA